MPSTKNHTEPVEFSNQETHRCQGKVKLDFTTTYKNKF